MPHFKRREDRELSKAPQHLETKLNTTVVDKQYLQHQQHSFDEVVNQTRQKITLIFSTCSCQLKTNQTLRQSLSKMSHYH